MRSPSGPGPFRPGAGRLPPYLAGREREQDLFRMLLDHLDGGGAPPSEVILHGPPGHGTTALLRWVREEARASTGVDVEFVTPAEFDSHAGVAESLLPSRWRPGRRSAVPDLEEVFTLRTGRRPLALLLDDAQGLDRTTGCELLNAAQSVGESEPFLLVLAGTPDLRPHLSTMGASFWGRGRNLRIGRLDEQATADAIRKPLDAENIAITDEALEHIVRESHGYPFFVQLWGDAVWARAAAASSQQVVFEDARACQADFDRKRDLYYSDRYRELKKLRLLRPARAVAETFESRPILSDSELEAAIRRGFGEDADDDEVDAAEREFHHLGLVWQAGAMPEVEPGIPSLMDYILRAVPAP